MEVKFTYMCKIVKQWFVLFPFQCCTFEPVTLLLTINWQTVFNASHFIHYVLTIVTDLNSKKICRLQLALKTCLLCLLTATENLLGPFHGAIVVPSVTRCRRCCGHRCAGSARPYCQRHLVNGREAARCGKQAQHFSNASC